MFQFLDGAIGSIIKEVLLTEMKEFQFLDGAIGSAAETWIQDAIWSFNSLMVRLVD